MHNKNKVFVRHLLPTVLILSTMASACGALGLGEPTATAPPSATATVTGPLAGSPAPEATATSTPPPPTPTTPPSPTPTVMGPEIYPEGFNPLTGLAVGDTSLLQRRPVLIKVSNFPVSGRPHAGLSFADLVFEYYIGTGMTRFIAVHYGKDSPQSGPIRSGRLVDAQLTRLYGGILGTTGASSTVFANLTDILGDRFFVATRYTCPGLCTSNTLNTYSTFADTAALTEYATERGVEKQAPPLQGMMFEQAPPEGGEEASHLSLVYSHLNRVGWDYDPERGVYLRSQDKADAILRPMPDRVTGEQLAFDNVVVLYTWHEVTTPTIISIEMWYAYGRPALFFRDGKVYRGRFTFVGPDLPLRFLNEQGTFFPLKPGNTWFQVVGLDSTTEGHENGSWRVTFVAP